ncbi:hypothetical protein Ae201684P_016634 [Aphanomyces euteiches]|nr:hypothetical protein Ae201684P_016634 [Aphanomyces euteiches]
MERNGATAPSRSQRKSSKGSGDDSHSIGSAASPSSSSGGVDGILSKQRSRSKQPKSDESSSALSLPHSFDDVTPGSTPVAATRFRSFDDELKQRPPAVQITTTSRSSNNLNPKLNDAMRKLYESQVDKIRAQLAAVLDEKVLLQRTLASERRAFQTSTASLETRYRAEIAQLKNDKAAIEARAAVLERRVLAEKAQFSDLRISDSLAQEFQKQDKDSLTLVEFIQMRAYELIQPHVIASENAAKALDVLKTEHTKLQASFLEAERALKESKRRQEQTAHDLQVSEKERQELEKQLKAAAQSSPPPAAPQESIEWEEKYHKVEAELKQALRNHDNLRMDVERLEQQVQLLAQDKAYLLQDKEAALDKYHKVARQLDDSLAKARELELSKETFIEQLAQAREESRVLFEHRMEVELAKLQDASRKEMEILRDGGKQMYERENRMLREARQDCIAQIEHLQKRLAEFQHAYEDKVLEFTRLDAKWTTDCAQVRNDLNMKHFELTQLSQKYDDKVNQLHQAHLENEMLRQKVEVHKNEFAKLEATSSKSIAHLELALKSEREKLQAYDQLEVDMDNAILQSGALTDESLTTFAMIPTAPKRRQSVALAQKIVQYEQQVQSLGQELKDAIQAKEQLITELESAKQHVNHMHQPQQSTSSKPKRMKFTR